MMLDQDFLRQSYEATHGKDKFTREECLDMVLSACTPTLRKVWCGVFGLSEADTAWALAQPYPEAPKGRRQRTDAEIAEARRAAISTEYRAGGFTEPELRIVASELLVAWVRDVPARLGRQPLPVVSRGKAPADMDSWATGALPWLQRATPAQPRNLTPMERVGAASRFWRSFVETVYANGYCNGTVPGLHAASLEWCMEPIRGDDGRVWPTLRLERILTGYYQVPDRDRAAMAQCEPEAA